MALVAACMQSPSIAATPLFSCRRPCGHRTRIPRRHPATPCVRAAGLPPARWDAPDRPACSACSWAVRRRIGGPVFGERAVLDILQYRLHAFLDAVIDHTGAADEVAVLGG